jgi:hypothetical protein
MWQGALAALLRELGVYVTSEESKVRYLALLLLASALEHPRLRVSDREALATLQFLLGRLGDYPSVEGCLRGMEALATGPQYAAQHSTTLADAAARICDTITREMHVPAMERPIRQRVFELFAALLRHGPSRAALGRAATWEDSDWKGWGELLRGVCLAMDGEKDPRCLLVCFGVLDEAVRAADSAGGSSSSSSTAPPSSSSSSSSGSGGSAGWVVEEVFDVTGCYFPISFRPPRNDPHKITRHMLRSSLERVLTASGALGPHVVPLVLEKLGSSVREAKLDALRLLTAGAFSYRRALGPGEGRALSEALRAEIVASAAGGVGEEEGQDAGLADLVTHPAGARRRRALRQERFGALMAASAAASAAGGRAWEERERIGALEALPAEGDERGWSRAVFVASLEAVSALGAFGGPSFVRSLAAWAADEVRKQAESLVGRAACAVLAVLGNASLEAGDVVDPLVAESDALEPMRLAAAARNPDVSAPAWLPLSQRRAVAWVAARASAPASSAAAVDGRAPAEDAAQAVRLARDLLTLEPAGVEPRDREALLGALLAFALRSAQPEVQAAAVDALGEVAAVVSAGGAARADDLTRLVEEAVRAAAEEREREWAARVETEVAASRVDVARAVVARDRDRDDRADAVATLVQRATAKARDCDGSGSGSGAWAALVDEWVSGDLLPLAARHPRLLLALARASAGRTREALREHLEAALATAEGARRAGCLRALAVALLPGPPAGASAAADAAARARRLAPSLLDAALRADDEAAVEALAVCVHVEPGVWREALHPRLRSALRALADARPGADSDSAEVRACVATTAAAAQALVARGHAHLVEALALLLEVLGGPLASPAVASAVGACLTPPASVFDPVQGALRRPLGMQRGLHFLLHALTDAARVQPSEGGAARPVGTLIPARLSDAAMLALCSAAASVPLALLAPLVEAPPPSSSAAAAHAAAPPPLLAVAVHAATGPASSLATRAASLRVLHRAARCNVAVLAPHLQSLSRALAAAAAHAALPLPVRLAALDTLELLLSLPYPLLHPLRRAVIRALEPALDDAARSLRQRAARCRNLWFTSGSSKPDGPAKTA